jgi:anionic cell wall polymer biosynthesis LytR-Cps2A-Psr (LCP) family protein
MRNYVSWPKIAIGAAYIAIFFTGFFISYEGFTLSKIFTKNPLRNILPTPNAFAQATAKPLDQVEPEQQDKGTYNVLFLGHGGTGHPGGLLTDSIIVAHVDINTKKVTFISVPRDLWVTGNRKINSTGIADFSNTAPVVTSVTGLPINYYAAVDFNGLTKIVDLLGGISVNTPASFEDPFFPIKGQENNTCGKSEAEVNELKTKYSGYGLETQFTCRYERIKYSQGPADLTGTDALKYVRSRHGDSDFGRSARQFAVLRGIADKLISFQGAGKFDDIVGTVSGIVKTDLDAGAIKSIIEILGNPNEYAFNTIQLTTDNFLNSSTSSDGQFILLPKAGSLNFSEIKNHISGQI